MFDRIDVFGWVASSFDRNPTDRCIGSFDLNLAGVLVRRTRRHRHTCKA